MLSRCSDVCWSVSFQCSESVETHKGGVGQQADLCILTGNQELHHRARLQVLNTCSIAGVECQCLIGWHVLHALQQVGLIVIEALSDHMTHDVSGVCIQDLTVDEVGPSSRHGNRFT